MEENIKLDKNQDITINIPFLYQIGDVGFYTGKELNTIKDCKNEVIAEIESGINPNEIEMEVGSKEAISFGEWLFEEPQCTEFCKGKKDSTELYNEFITQI